MQIHLAEHLPKNEIIKLGSYYTPEKLVKLVHEYLKPYLEQNNNIILFDSAGGCGAFLFDIKHYNYRIAEYDYESCKFLKKYFNHHNIFLTNSLKNVSREKYSIPNDAFLIMLGNPPYNDITSEFKNGEKGENICDNDLFDRDVGISFLKSYNKLNANVVCVLHPLSYLIKETNFRRLKDFRNNYKLINGTIFSSNLFYGTGSGKFPILISLYERNKIGMSFESVKNWPFDILDSSKKFILSKFQTTDGYINKYPPRKNEVKKSPIGLYYYSFRDFNSLKKNTSFLIKEHPNSIVVTIENFYKYAYLYTLKILFNPKDAWLYGNLSPLIDVEDVEINKKLYVNYTIKSNKVVKELDNSVIKKIYNYYEINAFDLKVENLEEELKSRLNLLIE